MSKISPRSLGLTLAALFIGLVLAGFGPFATTLQADQPQAISYCGTPGFHNEFAAQEGYSLNLRCTGVQIENTRIDVSVNTWDGSWGCHTAYTAYTVENDGSLTNAVEFEEEATVNGVEIDKSGYRFASYDCQYVSTSYDVNLPGELFLDTDAAEQVRDGDNLDVRLPVENRFDYTVDGTVTVTVNGPDGSESVEQELRLSPGANDVVAVSVPVNLIGTGDATIESRFDGKVVGVLNDWKGVNLDCDNDNVVEPVQDCDGDVAISGSETVGLEISNPSVVTQVERFVNLVESRFWEILAVLTQRPSPAELEG